jgi:hypothetical protein
MVAPELDKHLLLYIEAKAEVMSMVLVTIGANKMSISCTNMLSKCIK